MNFCLPFMIGFPYNDEIMEFTIKYDSMKDKYEDLINFVETYSDRRINIELTYNATSLNTLLPLLKINPAVYLKLNEGYIHRVNDLKESGIPFFFTLQCSSWDSLNSLINIGVSDVYLTNELGFNLLKIQKMLQYTGIRTRAIVNVAQMADPFNVNARIKAFFIRPEDIGVYQDIIDTFEFFATNQAQYEVLYDTYVHNESWEGNLAEIIMGLGIDVDSRAIAPDFGVYREDCGKRCFSGSSCHICDRVHELAIAMEDKDLMFTEDTVV